MEIGIIPEDIICKYYSDNKELLQLLLIHSRKVAQKALQIAGNSGRTDLDLKFVEESAMLHDIGIFRCNAPGIYCYGTKPYICHGEEGRMILEAENLPRHALVCERHTGSGLTAEEIANSGLPLPHRDMLPLSPEEKLVCLADKFYSKSGDPAQEKTIENIMRSMQKFGDAPLRRFAELCREFGIRI